MKSFFIYSPVLWTLFLLIPSLNAEEQNPSSVYPSPSDYVRNKDYRVKINGQESYVYSARINVDPQYHSKPHILKNKEIGFAPFDLTQPTEVEVECLTGKISHAAILPEHTGINPAVEKNIIRFTLPKPGNYILELNQDSTEHLYLFANTPERNIPSAEDPHVMFFGPGVHEKGAISLKGKENYTIYLSPGAILKGSFLLENCRRIQIRGRGVVDLSSMEDGKWVVKQGRNPFLLKNCGDVSIEGIQIIESYTWNIRMESCQKVDIRNVRIIGWIQNTDGIDPMNCEDVTIEDCFMHNNDDGVVLKTIANPSGGCRNISVRRCVIITDRGCSLKIGANEMHGKYVENILFEDCDVLRGQGDSLGVMNGGYPSIDGVTFRNIRIDHPKINSFTVFNSNHNFYQTNFFKAGPIRNILFDQVKITGDTPGLRCEAVSWESSIQGVTFQNCTLNGTPLTSTNQLNLTMNEFARDVQFISGSQKTTIQPSSEFKPYPPPPAEFTPIVLEAETAKLEGSAHTIPEPKASQGKMVEFQDKDGRIIFEVELEPGTYRVSPFMLGRDQFHDGANIQIDDAPKKIFFSRRMDDPKGKSGIRFNVVIPGYGYFPIFLREKKKVQITIHAEETQVGIDRLEILPNRLDELPDSTALK